MGGGRWRAPAPDGEIVPATQARTLVHRVPIDVKSLAQRGRAFPWPRPVMCFRCDGLRIWGHGFVESSFDDYATPLLLRRYRCPDCGLVIRMRPAAYWQRMQASIAAIRTALLQRLRHGRWPPGISTARARLWLRGLRQQVTAHLSQWWRGRLAKAFDKLQDLGICAVSRSV